MESNIYPLYKILNYLTLCMKYTGVGNYWFKTSTESILYKTFHYIIFACYYLMFILECLEVIFNTYPTDLHNDAVTFVIAHFVVIIRVRMIIYHKEAAKKLGHDIIRVCEDHEDDETRSKQLTKVKYLVVLQFISVIGTMASFVAEAVRRVREENLPFIPVITYYPAFEDSSYTALAIRLAITIIQFHFLCSMISCDNLAISYLIFLSFKFMTLNKYFRKLGQSYEINCKIMSKSDLKKWFRERCLEGFEMHRELKRLSTVVYDIFGAVMSIQVTECIVVIIQILLRITLSSQLTITAVAMNLLFIFALLIALGLYSWNGGEITYQASLISTAVFHCGWHLQAMEDSNNDVRRLILMGCAQAQRPVVLKAFGVHVLSYETFVRVLRTIYSIFAVLH